METPELPDISTYAAPIYVALILAEIAIIAWLGARGKYESRDTVTSLLMGTGTVLAKIVFGTTVFAGIYALYMWVWQYRLMDIPFAWWAVVLCFIIDDFAYYWVHRLQHEIRWGWASHVIHHSSQHFNLSTALRQPWFGFTAMTFLLSVPVVWLGFHPAMVAFVGSLNLFYQFFVHTEVVDRLPGPIEAVFNTPSHHRVHHGRNPRYLDANYAGVLIVWDRLFGTFVPEDKAEPVQYGIVKDIGTFNPLRVATHEYVAIAKDVTRKDLTWLQRLGYMFAPPGWSHDGSRMTSTQLKEAAGLEVKKKGTSKGAPVLAE